MNQNRPQLSDGFDWIDGQHVMQMLDITKDGLKKWRRARKITYSKFNGKLLYSRTEIVELVEKNKRMRE